MNTGTSPYRRGGAPGTRAQFLTKADYGIWDVREYLWETTMLIPMQSPVEIPERKKTYHPHALIGSLG